jgi:hypothetical protein
MTGEVRPASPELPDWTRELLNLTEASDPRQIREEVFRQLDEQNLLPSPELYAALHVALRDQLPADDRAAPVASSWIAEERALRRRLDEFAGEFFDQEPAERSARWTELNERLSAHPALRQRLAELQPGLRIDTAELDSLAGDARRIASGLLELFPLPPPRRAIARREWIAEIAANRDRWKPAAVSLRRQTPRIAALDDELVQWIIRPPKKSKVRLRRSKAATASERGSGGSLGSWALILVAILVIRAVALTSNSPPRPSSASRWTGGAGSSPPSGFDAIINQNLARLREQNTSPPGRVSARDLPTEALHKMMVDRLRDGWNRLQDGQIMETDRPKFKIQRLPYEAIIYHDSRETRTALVLPTLLMQEPDDTDGTVTALDFQYYKMLREFLESQRERVTDLVSRENHGAAIALPVPQPFEEAVPSPPGDQPDE